MVPTFRFVISMPSSVILSDDRMWTPPLTTKLPRSVTFDAPPNFSVPLTTTRSSATSTSGRLRRTFVVAPS